MSTHTKTETGSQLINALEDVWTAIRNRHPEVPEVVMITGSGQGMLSLTWGHFGREFWANGRFRVNTAGEIERDRKHELFVSGETLGVGAVKTLQTLLHEASHAVAAVRDVKDTSRQHRYHNRRFLAIAQELGLDYRPDAPDKTLGFSAVELTDDAREDYADVLARLDAVIALTMELPEWARFLTGQPQTPSGGANGQDGGDGTRTPRKPRTGRSSSLVKCVCECGRIIRVARATLELADITCDRCAGRFLESA